MDCVLNNKKPNINLKYAWKQLNILHYKVEHHFILIPSLLFHYRKFQCPSVTMHNLALSWMLQITYQTIGVMLLMCRFGYELTT